MRIVFMGTPEFAVPCLERLLNDGHQVTLVVTQADKPKGRGHRLQPTPVKACAEAHGVEVFQPEGLRGDEAYRRIEGENPDLIVVTAYGRILPQRILEIPRCGCINVHASLLPKYRGAAPIQWAVINGESESGVTTMQMNTGLDTGDMLLKRTCPIFPDMTAGELHDRLAQEGAQVLSDTLKALEAGALRPQKQEEAASSYAPMLDKSLGRIDWTLPASVLHNRVRGLSPWPSVTVFCQGKPLKLHRTAVGEEYTDVAPGTIVKENPLTIACGGGTTLLLQEIQAEGTRRMTAEEYLCGHPLPVGSRLESDKE
ncbi:MAG: methionyl-tRNA formyltransferase [Clostridiales bacterium]|nr:methionyl-tRNA formyltransferase [Clostridiales bacterium]